MSALSLPGLRLDHLLGATAAALVALTIWPWVQPLAPAKPAAQTGEAVSPPAPVPALPPVARFSAIAERPLFSPSRRPVPGEKSGPAGPGIEQRYQLLGLINSGNTKQALLAEGKRRFAIAEGATLEGWMVAHIEHDRVVLASPAGTATLRMQPTAGEERANPPPAARPPLPEKPPVEKPGGK